MRILKYALAARGLVSIPLVVAFPAGMPDPIALGTASPRELLTARILEAAQASDPSLWGRVTLPVALAAAGVVALIILVLAGLVVTGAALGYWLVDGSFGAVLGTPSAGESGDKPENPRQISQVESRIIGQQDQIFGLLVDLAERTGDDRLKAALFRTLTEIAGVDLGTDPQVWRNWWETQRRDAEP